MTDDIVARLRALNRCVRCDCGSCRSGHENHEHICTDGQGCVKPLERRLRAATRLALVAADALEIAEMRSIADTERADVWKDLAVKRADVTRQAIEQMKADRARTEAAEVRIRELEEERFELKHEVCDLVEEADYHSGMRATAEARVRELEAELADMKKTLADPVAVHANMLRGEIAKPSWENIKHLYPEEFERALAEAYERCAKVATSEVGRYQKLLREGKGEHGKAGYVRDDVWTSWNARESQSRRIAATIRKLAQAK